MAGGDLDDSFGLTGEHSRRDRRAARYRCHRIAQFGRHGLRLECLGDRGPHAGDLARTADHEDLVHVERGHVQVLQALLHRPEGAVDEVADRLLQFALVDLDTDTVGGDHHDGRLGGKQDLVPLHVQPELALLCRSPGPARRRSLKHELTQPPVDLQAAELCHSA